MLLRGCLPSADVAKMHVEETRRLADPTHNVTRAVNKHHDSGIVPVTSSAGDVHLDILRWSEMRRRVTRRVQHA